MQRSVWLWVAMCALILGGCLERKGAAVGPNVSSGQEVDLRNDSVSSVDVLFVIDNSGSMTQEQDNLAEQIPNLVRDLASPPDRDMDGEPDWNPVEELRIAITTTDVGTGGVSISGSHCMLGGDDGGLRGGVFTWTEGQSVDVFAAEVRATVESLGVTGCAFEQPLEAAARAVARSSAASSEAMRFPRPDGLFALIVVTDEEDCSVADDDAFFTGVDPATYNVHCGRHETQLTPVADLLEEIRGSRGDNNFLFAAIAGIPVDVPIDVAPSALLAREDMMQRETSDPMPSVVPVCEAFDGTGMSLGQASPGRRLVQLAELVRDPVLTTICTDDFGPAIDEIAKRFGSRVGGVCLIRPLEGASVVGSVPCEVSVVLPLDDRCDAHPGYILGENAADGREVCAIDQIADASAGSGWYYDPSHEECPQLALTEDAEPPFGAEIHAECFFTVERPLGELCARNTQCASGYCDPVTDACAPLPEVSDPASPPTGG